MWNMIRCDVYLLQLGFHSVAVGPDLLHNTRTAIYIRRNNTNHRSHKIESKIFKNAIKIIYMLWG